MAKFIEDAVQWRVLDQTITDMRGKFADFPADALQTAARVCAPQEAGKRTATA